MTSENKEKKSIKAIEKDWKALERREERISRISMKEENPAGWRQVLDAKVPDKIHLNLEKTFCKAFTIIFEKGTGIIEKSYNQEKILENLKINNYAFQVKANRKVLRKVRNGVTITNLGNMAATTAEGIGLGALGIGLPDIVVFIGVLFYGGECGYYHRRDCKIADRKNIGCLCNRYGNVEIHPRHSGRWHAWRMQQSDVLS